MIRTRTLPAALVAALALPAAAPAQSPLPIRLGTPAAGVLSAGDPVVGEYGPAKVYRFTATQGQRVIAVLRSDDFDAFLTLGRGTDDPLFSDDDAAGGTDARVRATLERGEYTLTVQALGETGAGAYTLSLADAPPSVRHPAQPMRVGETASGALREGDMVLEEDDTFYDLYALDLRAGQRVDIVMRSSEFDTFLAFGPEDEGELAVARSNDDGGEGTDSRVRMTIPTDGRYLVRANSLTPDSGSYTLQVSLLPPAPAPRPLAIPAGREVAGALEETDAALEDDSFYDAYTYRGRAGERLVVTMRAAAFDTFVSLGTLDGGAFRELASMDDGADGTDTRLEVTLPADGEYLIRANSLGSFHTGAYTLRVDPAS